MAPRYHPPSLMAATDTTTLAVESRVPGGSRSTRRLRRDGFVPGVLYGGAGDALPFRVESRTLRQALAHGGAVIELTVGGDTTPVVVKDEQRHPVTGALVHVDLLRVRLDVAIEATTVLELTGVEDAPGVKEGGVLEQVTRELNIEALPTAIPDSISHDVSGMEMNDTLMLASITTPAGVTLLDDLEETVIANLSPPRVEEEPEVQVETELVGEDGEPIEAPEGDAEGDAPAEGDADAGGDSGGDSDGE